MPVISRGILSFVCLSRLVLERVLPSFSPSFGRSGAAVVGRRGARAVFLMRVCSLLDLRAFFFRLLLAVASVFSNASVSTEFHFSSISDFNFNSS